MKKSRVRAALCSSALIVLPAVPAAILLPSQAAAQSTTCTADGSNNITCIDGAAVVATGSGTGGALTILAPPQGLATTSVGFQTIVLSPGAGGDTIWTSNAGTPGIDLTAGGALTLNAGSINVSTTGAASNAVELTGGSVTGAIGNIFTNTNNSSGVVVTASGNVDLTVGDVDYGGEFSDGVVITSTAGAIDVDIGMVTNHASGASNDGVRLTGGAITATIDEIDISTLGGVGLLVTATGNVDINVGNVTNYDAGIRISAGANNVDLTCGNVTTEAPGANSSSVTINATGTVDLTCGDISTLTGAGGEFSKSLDINGGAGAITATIGDVVQDSNVANAVEVTGTGAITLTTGNVTSDNYSSSAIFVAGGAGAIDVTCGNVTTASQNNNGVTISGTGTIDVACGTLTSTWDSASSSSTLLNITGGSGAINASVGDVTTSADGSHAITISGTGPITLEAGNVTNTGEFGGGFGARGVTVSGGAGAIDVTLGNVSVTSDLSSGVSLIGTGPITLDAGNITADGVDTRGLFIDGGTGPINASFGDVTVTGDSDSAIFIDSSGTLAVDGGNVSIAADGETAVSFTASSVGGTLGNISATGAGSSGLIITGGVSGLTIGNVISSQDAVVINAAADAVDFTCGNLTTTEANAPAFGVNSTGIIDVQCGLLTTAGANSIGLDINGGGGAITASISGAATTGINSDAVQITGTGPLTFTNMGSITTTGVGSNGIDISGVTTAAVTCGNVSTTAAATPAVVVAANGNTTVTCGTVSTTGADSDAIVVGNTAGTTTVTGGTTSATGLGSNGIVVASSAAGATAGVITLNTGIVTANGDAVIATSTGGGNVVVTANGNVTSTTGAGIIATTGGTATVVVNSGRTVQGATNGVQLAGTTANVLTVNGTLRSSTTGNAAYTVSGGPLTLNLSATGSIVGPLAFTPGNDIFNNAANYTQSGVIDFGLGNDTFNNSGTFTQTAAVNFGVGNDILTNSGTYNAVGTTDFGAGTDVATNTGTLRMTGGAATFANLEAFSNAGGVITMVDGAANDTFTISGNYAGSGSARLDLDVVGSGGANTADLLVISGNITGTTTVLPNFINPEIDPDGVLIVDGGGTLGANAFTLGGVTHLGLVNFSLLTSGNNVFLISTPDEAIFDIGTIGTMAQDIWYQSGDAYLACAASRRNDFGSERSIPVAVCAQLYGSSDRSGDSDRTATVFGTPLSYSDRLRTTRRGAQVDLGAAVGGNFTVGLTAGYAHAESDLSTGTEIDVEGHNIGAFAQFGSTAGFYAGLMAKRDKYDVRFGNAASIGQVDTNAKSTGIDGELGWRTTSFGAMVDLNAGLSYVKSKLDDFAAGNIAFDNDPSTSLRGRLGARAGWSGRLGPFIAGTLYRDFKGDDDIGVASGSLVDVIRRRGRGTWGRLEAGLGAGAGGGPLLSVWGDLGNVKGWGVRAGFRF